MTHPAYGLLRRTLATCMLLLMTCGAALAAFPDHPVRIVVPYPPGGGNDLLARTLGQKLAELLGQPVIIDNKAGAGGNIGAEFVARSPADGYTLLMASNQLIISPLLSPANFDALKDLTPVAGVADVQFALVTHPSLPVKSVAELIAYARRNPRALNHGTPGNGTPQHLAAELLNSLASISMTHVPYKGTAPAVTDLLAGQTQLAFVTVPSAEQYVRSGRLNVLAVTGARRSSVFPEVPTVAQAGVPGYEAATWFALVAPGATPAATLATLGNAIAKVLEDPAMAEKLKSQGFEPNYRARAAMGSLMRTDVDKWGRLIKDAQIKGD